MRRLVIGTSFICLLVWPAAAISACNLDGRWEASDASLHLLQQPADGSVAGVFRFGPDQGRMAGARDGDLIRFDWILPVRNGAAVQTGSGTLLPSTDCARIDVEFVASTGETRQHGFAATARAFDWTFEPSPYDLNETAEQFREAAAALATGADEIRAAVPTPESIVAEVGNDPVALTAWVAANTAWVPYLGTLRGAAGVLSDRIGNSLDRALLLHRLITVAGQEARLANATVGADALPALIEEAALSPVPIFDTWTADPWATTALPVFVGAEPPATPDYDPMSAIEPVTEALLATAPSSWSVDAETARMTAALADHWWVQVLQDGTWTDLDPGSLHFRPGITASRTLLPADIGPELRHQVRLRFSIEVATAGKTEVKPVLDVTYAPTDLPKGTMTFGHFSGELTDMQPWQHPSGAGMGTVEVVAAVTTWTPALFLADGRVVAQANFAMDGTVGDSGAAEIEGTMHLAEMSYGAATNALGGAADVLGGLFGTAPAPTEAPPAGEVVAEWLEITITVPGREPTTYRRALFDLTDDAARAAGTVAPLDDAQRQQRAAALVGPTAIATFAASEPSELVLADMMSTISVAFDGLSVQLEEIADARSNDLSRQGSTTVIPGFYLRLYNALRFELTPLAGATYIDRPNVALVAAELAPDDNGELQQRMVFDIVENGVGVTAAARDAAFAARVGQGVADTVVEAVVLGGPSPSIGNAAMSHAADISAGAEWIDASGYAAPAALVADRSGGWQVVAAAGADAAGPGYWWRIDPQTGQTLGQGGDGRGATYSEWLQNIYLGVSLASDVFSVGLCWYQAYNMKASRAYAIAAGVGCTALNLFGLIGDSLKILRVINERRINAVKKALEKAGQEIAKIGARSSRDVLDKLTNDLLLQFAQRERTQLTKQLQALGTARGVYPSVIGDAWKGAGILVGWGANGALWIYNKMN